ncbi:hypothetical protein ANN_05777 [Periplaneta americana]|uniref:Uncharacterized protein n=1 Tax=Periplaneta americana TaxID=6978 RepID=A0ABQ8TDH8_PERAM|nr:hypothetical protein ANN_05777 [Periplaneta americana]
MKIFFALITTCAVFALLRAQAPGFGSGDISSVVGNRNYIERQIDCVLSRSPCDDVGRNLISKFCSCFQSSTVSEIECR